MSEMKQVATKGCVRHSTGVRGFIKWAITSLGLYTAVVLPALAGVSLLQTRIVYPQSAQSVSVTLHNSGNEVYLVQAAVMDWDTNKTSPLFSVQPPLFRVEAMSNGVVRVVRTGGGGPQDRESVFRFRINAIPSGTAPIKGGASLSIALGMGIKLFYRPDGLEMNPDEAYGKLNFSRQGNTVVVKNPTPYYLTFARLSLGGELVNMDKFPAMIAPFSQARYPEAGHGSQVEWVLITDYGGNSDTYYAQIK
ncbi:fimbrial biogenesis chaperone [Enterobacter ludwigii]|uniref:fimbrial biogenesis chaperone n=1 Tax=Enterobacter ludwigii TaxID=299767 RepID=UPI001D02F87D|nr:molecular chaperone [Enterobacter ludwigii]